MAEEKNMEKYEAYKSMHEKLNKAIRLEFYFEAIFIEYAIFEDRLRSLLRHADVTYMGKNGNEDKISKKISKVKDRPEFQEKYIRKRLPSELMTQIEDWVQQRNAVVHNLANLSYNDESLRDMATEGKELVKIFSTRVKGVNNFFEKQRRI